jgi:3-hydroxyacyl-CoA dehydrogenase
MGTSITACLLAAGHVVTGLETETARRRVVKSRVLTALKRLAKEGLMVADPDALIRNLTVSASYSDLADAAVVVESITENLDRVGSVAGHADRHEYVGDPDHTNTKDDVISGTSPGIALG